jgi:hypothetical protein
LRNITDSDGQASVAEVPGPPALKAKGAAMPEHRIFTIGPDGHFIGVPKIAEFADDKEVVETAMRTANGADIEIWNLARLVVRLPGNSPKASRSLKRPSGSKIGTGGIIMLRSHNSKDTKRWRWRNRAAKMRALAGTMVDSNAAVLLTDLAAHYDELAENAALKANGKKPPSNGKLR